jgi:hypothetical protein
LPIYEYEHPTTGEIFEDIRPFSKADKPYIASDGAKCVRVPSIPYVFDADRENDYQDMKSQGAGPNTVIRFKDGHKEKFDPTKHGLGGSGSESHLSKQPLRRKQTPKKTKRK